MMEVKNRIILLTVSHFILLLVSSSWADDADIFSGNFDNQLWIYSNFPVLDAFNISEQCVKDTKQQFTALRHGLAWATKSKLTINYFDLKFESFMDNC